LTEQREDQRPQGGTATSAQPDVRLSAEVRAAIIAAARSLIGTPFLHQGRDPKVGVDCQGFILCTGAIAGYRFTREWPNNHRRYGNDKLLREALGAEFRKLPSLEHAQPADVILVELPRRRNLHVGIMAEGEFGTELIHSLAFDNAGAVKADRFSRWKVVDAFTWYPERFTAHSSLLTAN